MKQSEEKVNIISKRLKMSIATAAILAMFSVTGFARDTTETIDAQAYGTSTQLGKNFTVRLLIYEYSTPADRQILIESFAKGQNNGLANALEKMKAVGRITMPGTLFCMPDAAVPARRDSTYHGFVGGVARKRSHPTSS